MAEDFDPWWRDGICAEIGADMFFVKKNDKAEVARAACAICPVRQQCLTDALESRVEYGVFGGLGRDERRRLIKQVDKGRDPADVAAQAIEKDRRRREQRDADLRDRVHPRRGGAVVPADAAGPEEKRAAVAAPGARPDRLGLRRRARRTGGGRPSPTR